MKFSKILVKLIDQAIVPALTLLSVRFAFLIGVSKYYGFNISMSQNGFVFESASEYKIANTYSLFAMIAVLAIALVYVLLKAFIFHDTHIKPGLTAKLFSLNLSAIIDNSFDLYSYATIWLLFSYLLTAISGLMLVYNAVESWVFYTSLILTIIATALLVIDVENEIDLNKSSNFQGWKAE